MATNDYSAIFQEAARAHNVDPLLLRAAVQVESSGNPNAVSEVGAQGLGQLMPKTAKALGVKNAFDPRENIFGAAKLLDENLTRYGNPEDAILAYHGGTDQNNWGPKTRAHLVKVKAEYQKLQGSKMPSTVNTIGEMGANDDAFTAYFSGKSQPAAAPANDPFTAYFGSAPAAQPVKTAATAHQQAAPQSQRSALEELGRQIALTGRAGITGLAGLPNLAGDIVNTGLNYGIRGVNALGGNIPELQMPSAVTQQALNAVGLPQPENAQERIAQDVASSLAGAGGQLGLARAVGNAASASDIARRTGQMLSTAPGMQLLGSAGGAGASAVTREAGGGEIAQLGAGIAGSLAPVLVGSALTRAMSRPKLPTAAPRVEPTLGQPEPAFNIDISGTNVPTPQQLASGLAANEAGAVPVGVRPTNVAPQATQLGQALASNEADLGMPAQPRPARGIRLRNPQAAPPVNAEPFEVPSLPAPKTSLPIADQESNIATMNKIGLNSQRPSAITGDKFTAGQEFQQAKLDTPVGEVVRNQLQSEQNAIKNYAQGIVKNTGASATSPEIVGQSVRSPLQGLSEHYDGRIGQLYNAADNASGGIPSVKADSFGKLMETNSVFAGKQENSALRRGIRSYMREQGIVDGQGKLQPITVQQAEGMRQYLNSQWSPQNSGLIGKIKESLDLDVAKTGGGDLYKQARALHAERKNTLDNPNGIAALLTETGPEGINKIVPDERVGAKLLSMPTQQFEHVINTLKNVPEDLRPQAQQALSEIKAVLAEKIRLAGDKGGNQNGPSIWNAADVTRELNKQNSKLSLVFSPEEMDSFHTLNRAGHILQTPSAYPGAAVQGHNLAQRGFIMAPAAAGTMIGAHIGGPLGAAGGAALGSALSKKAALSVDRKMAEKLAEELLNPKALRPK